LEDCPGPWTLTQTPEGGGGAAALFYQTGGGAAALFYQTGGGAAALFYQTGGGAAALFYQTGASLGMQATEVEGKGKGVGCLQWLDVSAVSPLAWTDTFSCKWERLSCRHLASSSVHRSEKKCLKVICGFTHVSTWRQAPPCDNAESTDHGCMYVHHPSPTLIEALHERTKLKPHPLHNVAVHGLYHIAVQQASVCQSLEQLLGATTTAQPYFHLPSLQPQLQLHVKQGQSTCCMERLGLHQQQGTAC
jgi:hypothetical protein